MTEKENPGSLPVPLYNSGLNTTGSVNMKKNDEKNIIKYALDYINRGWHVFQLPYQNKTPFKGSQGFKDATINPEQVKHWFCGLEKKNIAIRTGKISNLVVVDIDRNDRKDGFKSIEKIVTLPNTYTVKTKQGIQLYFSYPKNGVPIDCTQNLGEHGGIDIRGNNGYVVAPPSFHPCGQEYKIEKNIPIAPLPESIISLYLNGGNAKKTPKKSKDNRNGTQVGSGFVIMPNDLIKKMAQSKLSGPQQSIYMYMRGKCGFKDKGVYSSNTVFECQYSLIESDLGYKAKTITNSIYTLLDKGFILFVTKGGSRENKKLPSVYRLSEKKQQIP